MTQIARKYDFKAGQSAKSAQVDEELDQLVQAHNDLDTNKVNRADVLVKGDATPYVPVASTDPATKGYVDSTITGLVLGQVPDESITDPKIGTRTIDDSVVAADGADTPTRLWSKLANMIKAITGKANWYTPPGITLEAAKTHIGASGNVHGAISAATANQLVVRDANGRAQFADPAAAADAATKGYTDALKAIQGSYTGNGSLAARQISLGFTPSLVIIFGGALADGSASTGNNTFALINGSRGYADYTGASFKSALIVVSGGFQVGDGNNVMNVNGSVYNYVAFR